MTATRSRPAPVALPGVKQGEVLRFGVPSKGRNAEPAHQFLDACGLRVRKDSERQLTATIGGLPGVTVVLQRSEDILIQVADGRIDIGITGLDILRERAGEREETIVLYDDLGFSRADLVVEVPDSWVDVSTLADLADVAASMREQGESLRVATSFPNLTRRFFYEKGISHFSLVHAEGGIEAAPAMGFADITVDLATTGVTLRENHLKVLRNGTILRSQSCLVGNRRALAESREKREVVRRIVELIEAHLRARAYYSVTANLKAASEQDVADALLASPATRGQRGPTVARVYTMPDPSDGSDGRAAAWFAATIIVDALSLQDAVDHLRAAGGSGMSVVPVKYLFDERSQRYEQLLAALGVKGG
jgi:ATP phosphoribosyltransferase